MTMLRIALLILGFWFALSVPASLIFAHLLRRSRERMEAAAAMQALLAAFEDAWE
jgi:hypothetical protein